MATNFPTSIDSFTNPSSGDTLDSPSHSAQHTNINDAMVAVQTKLGVGSGTIGTWTTFTPSWNNFTVGNAVQDWSYCIINDVMIVTGRTVLGTTSSMGTNPSFDIPAGKTADKWARGSAILREEGVATLFGALSTTGPGASSIGVFRYEVSGSNIRSNLITSSTPFSWGNTDYISGTLVFDVT